MELLCGKKEKLTFPSLPSRSCAKFQIFYLYMMSRNILPVHDVSKYFTCTRCFEIFYLYTKFRNILPVHDVSKYFTWTRCYEIFYLGTMFRNILPGHDVSKYFTCTRFIEIFYLDTMFRKVQDYWTRIVFQSKNWNFDIFKKLY